MLATGCVIERVACFDDLDCSSDSYCDTDGYCTYDGSYSDCVDYVAAVCQNAIMCDNSFVNDVDGCVSDNLVTGVCDGPLNYSPFDLNDCLYAADSVCEVGTNGEWIQPIECDGVFY
tara:strand:+ start:383 stop:733 length:351 start_codon:yes stop_codon:yes gene_type:complete